MADVGNSTEESEFVMRDPNLVPSERGHFLKEKYHVFCGIKYMVNS